MFFTGVNGYSIYIQQEALGYYMIYWTHLNLTVSLVVSVMSAILVTLYYFDLFIVENSMPFILKLYWASWNQITVFSILISLAFWTFFYKPETISLYDISVHVLNSFVPFIDIWIVNHPPRYSHFWYVTISGLDYAVFTIIYQYVGGLNK